MDTETANQPPAPAFDLAAFKQLYKKFDKSTVNNLPNIYSPAVVFKDPVHNLQGIAELSTYFAAFCTPEMHCEFDIINEVVAIDQAFLQWNMRYRHSGLQGGKTLTLNGGTLIKFNTKITYHEDFYDMGAMVYQHLPILGWVVKKINARMTEPTS